MEVHKTVDENVIIDLMKAGEFPEQIINSAEYVLVILTQSWCSQWKAMKGWIPVLMEQGDLDRFPFDCYLFIYNTSSIFETFRTYKETVFNNDEIPYIRWYRNGELKSTSNYIGKHGFVKKLESL